MYKVLTESLLHAVCEGTTVKPGMCKQASLLSKALSEALPFNRKNNVANYATPEQVQRWAACVTEDRQHACWVPTAHSAFTGSQPVSQQLCGCSLAPNVHVKALSHQQALFRNTKVSTMYSSKMACSCHCALLACLELPITVAAGQPGHCA